LKKTIQDLKMEIESIKKSQRKTTLEIKKKKKTRKEIRSHKRKHHQQNNTRDRRENLRYRRYH
jgi:FtsZ-binding cell division protein ZapB